MLDSSHYAMLEVKEMHYFYEEHRQYSIMPSREGLWMLWYMRKASAH